MSQKKILLIGGGTGGHILPLRNLVTELLEKSAVVELVVADSPLDKKIIQESFQDIPVHYFRAGKIRRYLSFQNFIDFFRIIGSFWTARTLLKKTKPDVLFFKGGFVGFPFLVAAKFLMRFRGKIYSHESDISVGIMTRMTGYFADGVFETFSTKNPHPLFYEPSTKESSLSKKNRPSVLIFGGSQGSEFINTLIETNLEKLSKKYHITLVSGLKKQILSKYTNFEQFEFLPVSELSQHIQSADLIISRAGANSLCEIISAKKPSIIIPLPSVARNHQMLNAQYFASQNLCYILEQNADAKNKIFQLIENVLNDKTMKKNLQECGIKNSAKEIAEEITT